MPNTATQVPEDRNLLFICLLQENNGYYSNFPITVDQFVPLLDVISTPLNEYNPFFDWQTKSCIVTSQGESSRYEIRISLDVYAL